jgi:hypothetical protein
MTVKTFSAWNISSVLIIKNMAAVRKFEILSVKCNVVGICRPAIGNYTQIWFTSDKMADIPDNILP